MLQASPSDMVTESLSHYFAHIVKVKFAHPIHLLTILTEHACHHNSFWGSRCDSNHAPTISLKPVHFNGDFGIRLKSRHTSLTSDHPRYFELFRPYFLRSLHISANSTKTNLSRLATQNLLKTNQSVRMFSTTLTVIHKESSFNVKPTKILSDFGDRG